MSDINKLPPWFKRGGVCIYHREPAVSLTIETEPFRFQGQMVVQCHRNAKRKADRQPGLYALEALRECVEETRE